MVGAGLVRRRRVEGLALEPILPVRLDLPEQLVVPEAAIVFVLDNSGSMAGSVLGSARSQQQIANQAAALAIRSLDERDLIGVISFNSNARLVLPLAKNERPEHAASAVESISSGGTNLEPALQLAFEQLKDVEAKLRHVIVLSDGRSRNEELLPDLAGEMFEEGSASRRSPSETGRTWRRCARSPTGVAAPSTTSSIPASCRASS